MNRTAFRIAMGAIALVGLLLIVMLGAAYAQQLAPVAQNAAVTSAEVNLTPLLNVGVELAAAILSAIAIPIFWLVLGWVKSKRNLAILQVIEANRATVDQGLQKSIGFGTAQFRMKSAELIEQADISFDVRNDLVREASKFALAHIPEALAAVGVTKETPALLAGMIEARLGMIAIGKATAPVSAGAAMATDPSSVTAGA